MSMKRGTLICIFMLTAWFSGRASSEITDYHIADVTSNGFTVIFASSDAIVAPDVRVYQDADGLIALTPPIEILSSLQQHQNGLSAIRVQTLNNTSTYYFSITTDSSSSPYVPLNILPSVTTFSLMPTTSTALIANDLIKLDIYKPDAVTSLQGAVVLLSLPSISPYPISSLVGVSQFAYLEANNLLQWDSDMSLLSQGQNLEITVLRGLLCSNAVDHLQVFYRKYGEDLLEGTQVNQATRCDAVDTVCDDHINMQDVQFVLNAIYSTPAECRFTEELDVVQDQQINVLDVQQVLNYL